MQAVKANGNIPHIAKLTVFCSPTGQLITRMGDQRVLISAGEAKTLLDELLVKTIQFASGSEKLTSDGHK